jgi:secreted Zn-dependent insulinase-like peptidase
VQLRTKCCYESALARVSASILVFYLERTIFDYVNDEEVAGLRMGISSIRHGIEFHSSGFSHHLLRFTQRCLQALLELQISSDTFLLCRERLKQELESAQMAPDD